MPRVYMYVVLSLVAIAIVIPIVVFNVSNATGTVYTFKPRPINDTSYLSRYYQVQYRYTDQIYEYILKLIKSYSFFCELDKIGHTSKKGPFPGFPIYLLKISSGFPKPIVLIIGGVNANDWLSVTSILYIANQFLANCSTVGQLITTYDWHFIPILNPDGYNYSQSTPAAMQWIKNMARWSINYVGVNINYNFGYGFRKTFNYNEDTYSGRKAFSEVESQSLRDYILRVKHVEMVIIFKSPDDLEQKPSITFPWSCTTDRYSHWVLLQYLGAIGAAAAENVTGTKYEVIQSGRQAGHQSGRIDDWLIGSAGIKTVLTVQRKFVADLVIDPYESITTVGSEMFAIVKQMASHAFTQPMSYRKTHRKIRANQEINTGMPIFKASMRRGHTVN